MKTNFFKLFKASIAMCMFAMFSLSLAGCSNDDDEIPFDYPEGAILPEGDDAKPFKLKDFHGTLEFDDMAQEWTVKLKYAGPPIAYNGRPYVIYVSNMSDEYKALAGEVLFSGIVKKLYTVIFNPELSDIYISYFSLEFTELSAAETN